MAHKINRDLENRLKSSAVELAESRGGEGLKGATMRLTQEKLSALEDEIDALRQQNARLQEQLQNSQPLEFQPPAGGGFSKDDLKGEEQVSIEDGKIVIEGDLLFASGKDTLRPEAKKALDSIVNLLEGKYSNHYIHLSGHTDNTPIVKSGHKSNHELASKRAHAVFTYLQDKGVQPNRLILHAFGPIRPASGADPNSKSGQAKCRRVEILLGAPLQ